MIIVLKVGENEPTDYDKYHALRHHYDIVQTFHPDITTLGTQGDKHNFVVNMDVSSLSEAEIVDIQDKLTSAWEDNGVVLSESLYYCHIPSASYLTKEVKNTVEQQANIKREISPQVDRYIESYTGMHSIEPSGELVTQFQEAVTESFNLKHLNDFETAHPLLAVAVSIINKSTSETLAQELGLI